MLLRIRSNVGLWRIDNLDGDNCTVSDVVNRIKETRPDVIFEKPLSFDPGCRDELDGIKTLSEQRLKHGSMVHCRVDPSTCANVIVSGASNGANGTSSSTAGGGSGGEVSNMKRIIDKDGNIKLIPTNEIRDSKDDKGFRKGMLPLRDMKMSWTLNDFIELDSKYEFKLKRQKNSICKQVSLDIPSTHDFQSYLQKFDFQRKHFGYLYGKYVDFEDDEDGGDKDSKGKNKEGSEKKMKRKAVVEAVYEPPQDVDLDTAEGFVLLDDPLEDNIEKIANLLGLVKVGWIFGHPPGRNKDSDDDDDNDINDDDNDKSYVLSSAEIIMAAEFQLEAADGVEETPFVTVKVTKGNDGNVSVEAFQVSQQCMAMVAEEALEADIDNPSHCTINETFTAIQEGKESKTVDNNFFLTVVPIKQHTSDKFISTFPKSNREHEDRVPSHDELKKQLKKSGKNGWSFVDLLSDFNLLIYLSQFLDVDSDIPKICQSINEKSIPLDDGYKILISSMAGLDGSY